MNRSNVNGLKGQPRDAFVFCEEHKVQLRRYASSTFHGGTVGGSLAHYHCPTKGCKVFIMLEIEEDSERAKYKKPQEWNTDRIISTD
jgi:hypothetical protein